MNSSAQNGAFFLSKKPAVLLLENHQVFHGYALGEIGTSSGELCFNTGMVGYQEILTDPSYCGQMVVMTYPLIGNYGINPEDFESDRPYLSGFIIKELSRIQSNWRSCGSLEDFLLENKVPTKPTIFFSVFKAYPKGYLLL